MIRICSIALLLVLGCAACEPFDLDQKNFPVCEKPSATIGYSASRLEVTFYLENQQGDIGAAGWSLGDGKNRSGNRFTVQYDQPGTYTVTVLLANQCDDKFTTSRQITVSN